MTELRRREFLRGALAAGALAALPGSARALSYAWYEVGRLIESLVPAKLPGIVAALGYGETPASFLKRGTLAKDSVVPVDQDTLWRVYSMTKPITGLAAMMLIEDGKLKLDQPIADFIPAYASMRVLTSPDTSLDAVPARARITVRHLLTHTAGLGYSINAKGPLLETYLKQGLTPAAISRMTLPGVPATNTVTSLSMFADRLAAVPLVAEPGTRWHYSMSLDLLARVIELAAGQSYEDVLQSRLFTPLGMTSSFFTVPRGEAKRLSTNYGVLGEVSIPVDPGATSIFLDPPPFAFGGAGLVMSARDYDALLKMLLGKGAVGDKRVMKPETVARAMSNLLPPGVDTSKSVIEGAGFGAGGAVALKTGPRGQSPGSFGWGGAAATRAWVDPVRNLRASGFAQYLPDEAYGFPRAFETAVYASL